MDVNLKCTDLNEKKDDRSEDEPQLCDPLTTSSKSPLELDESLVGQTGSLTEVTLSEQISTEDTELSSADVSLNVLPHKTTEAPVEYTFQNKPKSGASRAVSVCDPSSVEQDQPKPHPALLSSSEDVCTVLEMKQSFRSISRSQESLKTSTVHTEADGDDLCAAVLLACLFCHPLDCLLATLRGCNGCVWSLCSSLCGCEPTALQPLLDLTHHCDLCGCLGVRCFTCDCPICDVCLQATECLDLAMEISQMLYH